MFSYAGVFFSSLMFRVDFAFKNSLQNLPAAEHDFRLITGSYKVLFQVAVMVFWTVSVTKCHIKSEFCFISLHVMYVDLQMTFKRK